MSGAYYPSCVVNLSIVFDEALLASVTPPVPLSTDDTSDAPASGDGNARSSPDILTPNRVARQDKVGGIPTFIMGRVPKSCSVEMPSVRQASTFDLTFDFRELPIDPRTVRALGVEIHMGTVSAADFADGVRQVGGNRPRASQLRTRDDKNNPNNSTIVFAGIADEWNVEYTSEGAEINISGRDLRGLLLDSPITSRALANLNVNQRIDRVVRDVLAMHPGSDHFQVVVNEREWPDGIPGALPDDIIPRHRRGARGQRTAPVASQQGGTEMTYWDVIVRLCYLVGAIPYFNNRSLFIRPARGYFQQVNAGFDATTRTPFRPDQPRGDGVMAPWSVRRIIYGRNATSVKFNRKFGGNQKPKVVRVTSVDYDRAARKSRRLEARWPMTPPRQRTEPNAAALAARLRRAPNAAVEAASQAVQDAARNRVAPSGQQSQTDTVDVPVYGVRSQARLQSIARMLFEEISRNEMTGSCETKDLASYGGGNDDPDILRVRPGDAVEFFFDGSVARGGRESITSTAVDHFRAPFADQLREITERLGNEQLARAIMATSRGSVNRIQNFFRVSSVSLSWDATGTGGISASFEFQNYFVIRNDIGGADIQQALTPPTRTTVPSRSRRRS